eukprot:10340463-Alexandrium_andersonii.AAC.1
MGQPKQIADIRANADAMNVQELRKELRRVEIRSEEAAARLVQRSQQDAALVQNVLQEPKGV